MEWTRGPVIGRGSSAAVSLATTANGQLFAVKSADISSSTSLQNERCLISQLSSPFIVKCFGSDVTEEKDKSVYNIFMEYVAGGTLSDLIRNNGGSLRESAIRLYTHQLLSGLNYLHLLGFVHCDIKGSNILIGDGGVKIADFGCAKRAECGGFAGTPAYMAPEVARGEEQSFAADMWAVGCTVVEMATGANPWPEMKDPAAALYRVAYSGDTPEIPSWLSDSASDFLAKCFALDSSERWTAAELLKHPFLDSAEANCGGIGKSTKKSPTSVMDQRFWDEVEVLNSSPDAMENPSSSDSPAERIRGLIGGSDRFSSSFDFSDEDWMTVRSNGVEECSENEVEKEDCYEELIDEDCFTDFGIDEEEIETSVQVEDSLFHSYWDEISSIDISSAFHYILGDGDIDDSLPVSVTFRRMLMKEFFDSDQLFSAIFFVFSVLSLSLSKLGLFFAALFSKLDSIRK